LKDVILRTEDFEKVLPAMFDEIAECKKKGRQPMLVGYGFNREIRKKTVEVPDRT